MAPPPLLVFGPRSLTYDFGPSHPLTPRRFGPSLDLLRQLGAEPGLAPEPASDEDLLLCHTSRYIETVKRMSELDNDPWGAPEAGIGPGDDPPFPGMHEAGAAVAGGSIRAMEAILSGATLHAFHPGGGLHHAMPSRASGFCIYDDPALAIAKARLAGLRVLYIDLDVHHGDGVQAIHWDDPGVLTVSFHESGRYLFPGTGSVAEVGEGLAAGSAVNVPFEPGTGEAAWLTAVETLLPELAAAFGPDIVVSQHGCDTHASDPLAHLNVTTTAMGAAARLVDVIAHRWTGGRWLATGGGGYGVYRVVPRAWAHVWLAGAHREAPDRLPAEWRARWADEAARYGDSSLPETLDDPPNAGLPFDAEQREAEAGSLAIAELARIVSVPRLIREAVGRGWWSPIGSPIGPPLVADGRRVQRLDRRPAGDPRHRRSGDPRSAHARAAARGEPRSRVAPRSSHVAGPQPHDGGRRSDCRRPGRLGPRRSGRAGGPALRPRDRGRTCVAATGPGDAAARGPCRCVRPSRDAVGGDRHPGRARSGRAAGPLPAQRHRGPDLRARRLQSGGPGSFIAGRGSRRAPVGQGLTVARQRK